MLVLNVEVEQFGSGPGAGAEEVGLTLDAVKVVHRRRVNGVLQAPETLTVATGPVQMWLYVPERGQERFAGQYWLPPGEVQSVKIDVSDAAAYYSGGNKTIRFGQQYSGSTTSATLSFGSGSNPKPEISTGQETGVLVSIPAGQGGALSSPNSTTLLLGTTLPAKVASKPEHFGFSADTVLVHFLPEASGSAIAALEASTGATEVYTRGSGLRVLRFSGTDWGSITEKLLVYRASNLVGYAALSPFLEAGAPHDNTIYDDPFYESDEAAFLADIGVEDAWTDDAVVGARSIVVGVIDVGMDEDHPELVNNLYVNEGELPDVCGTPFADLFDLDGTDPLGHTNFTLHDLNERDSNAALSSALAEFKDCFGYALDPAADNIATTTIDDEIYQPRDLFALPAFANGADDDANCVVDDLFGANFSGSVSSLFDCMESVDVVDGCDIAATNDVNPDEDADNVPQHGTHEAGLIAAEHDNGANIAGVMGEVRFLEARVAQENCRKQGDQGDVSYDDILPAMDYLIGQGAQIVLIEFATSAEDELDHVAAGQDKSGLEFEDYPEVLFVLQAGNYKDDCDDPNIICTPAANDAANAVSVIATGIEFTGTTFPATVVDGTCEGPWVDPVRGKGSSFGATTMEIASPGYGYYNPAATQEILGIPSIGHGLDVAQPYAQWNPNIRSFTSGTSAASALTAGVAGLVLAGCGGNPTGAELASALLDGADARSPELDGFVQNERFLSATGGLLNCP